MNRLPFGVGQEEFLASMGRLREAGLIEQVVHDLGTASGFVRFTPAALILMEAGRNVFAEEGFIALWVAGDPVAVRRWVESEARIVRESGRASP